VNPNCRWRPKQVFIYRHPVDMRKQILGLSNIVSMQLGRDPGDESMYVFSNKARDKIKLLIWHRNGFWLLYSVSSLGWNIQKGESPFRVSFRQ